jgi:hypothetical protein
MVFINLRAVMQRHHPAMEIHHACTAGVVLFEQGRLLSHHFLIRNQRSHAVFQDEKRTTKPDVDTNFRVDANVLFCLNLPPKSAFNHKEKWVITLAYGQKTLKPEQHKKPHSERIYSD